MIQTRGTDSSFSCPLRSPRTNWFKTVDWGAFWWSAFCHQPAFCTKSVHPERHSQEPCPSDIIMVFPQPSSYSHPPIPIRLMLPALSLVAFPSLSHCSHIALSTLLYSSLAMHMSALKIFFEMYWRYLQWVHWSPPLNKPWMKQDWNLYVWKKRKFVS